MSDEDTPVSHSECRLHRALIEQRFGTIERDMAEVKRDMAEVKTAVGAMRITLSELSGAVVWTLRIVVAVLVLVAAGRGLDLSAILGSFP